MSSVAQELRRRIDTRTARVGVVGLGYVGLPLAVEFARAGFDHHRVSISTRARSRRSPPANRTSPTCRRPTSIRFVGAGTLRATTDYRAVADLDTVNICVPTPLRKTKDPDMSFVVSAVEAIAEHLHPGMLVILESTTYPGTTEELVQPILERTGLKAGVDFFLAFSPERVDPGNADVPHAQRTEGRRRHHAGVQRAGRRRSTGSAIETVVPVSSPRVAEMVKLLENTFRAVNIGLVNEIALMCDKLAIDVWEVVDAAKTKPFGFLPFYPGPGLGGHCIPIDPFYLSWKAKQTGFEARFIELAGQVNGAMPEAVVHKIADALNTHRKALNGSHVLIVGVAYKRDIDDIRESPSLDVMSAAGAEGRARLVHRPVRADARRRARGMAAPTSRR